MYVSDDDWLESRGIFGERRGRLVVVRCLTWNSRMSAGVVGVDEIGMFRQNWHVRRKMMQARNVASWCLSF